MKKRKSGEKELQKYLVSKNKEFIDRYIGEILYGDSTEKIEFLGQEMKTGNGLERCDLLYKIENSLDPKIIVVELKTNVHSEAIAQVSNYIKDMQKSKWYEEKNNAWFPYRYIGIVCGKWVSGNTKHLINADLSGQLSFIDFSLNEYKEIGTEGKVMYYEDQNYWFENGIFELN